MPTFSNNRNFQDWSYKCVGSVAQDEIISLLGDQVCLFYVRRQGAGKHQNEEIWQLTIATDRDDFPLPGRLEKQGKTLGLIAAIQEDGLGGLKVLSTRLLQVSRGHADGYSVPFSLRLLPHDKHPLGIPKAALARVEKMPVCGDHIPTEEQLQAWKAFLQVEENIAKARQFCVAFVGNDYGNNTRQITFEVDVNSATLDGSEQNYLKVSSFWERVKRSKNQEVKLSDTVPTGKLTYKIPKFGSIEKVDTKNCLIKVKVERELAEYIATQRYQPPVKGFLFFDAAGDIQQVRRKKEALEQLKHGNTQNPYLGNFLFDASQARRMKKTVELKADDLLLSSANAGQKAAVEKVLAAEDLILIQGPPGTGKTTVIAEICYQIALRGGRTLIASQANLAVDNALSRLVHNPVIRAVRKGRAERVGEEGQPFLEDQVIETWLENTATDCESSLAKRLENVKSLGELLAELPRFTDYFNLELERNQQQNQLNQEKETLAADCKIQSAIYQEGLTRKNQVESIQLGLDYLLKNAPQINWEAPEVTNCLPYLQPYTDNNIVVQDFLTHVQEAIKWTDELGLVRPGYGAFGLAVWLRENVADKIADFNIAFGYAQDAILVMSEVAEVVSAIPQNSQNLNSPEIDEQEFLSLRQILQQTIQGWQNRQREIDYVIAAIKEWKSTAPVVLYQIVKECQQSGQTLTEELVQLPLGLLMFANQLKLTILPKKYQIHLPDWKALQKALTYETEGGFVDRIGKQYHFSYFLEQNFSQIPIVLSASDRTQWRKIYEEFKNYQLLNPHQRSLLVENTQLFLLRMQTVYSKAWELNNLDATVKQVSEDLLTNILANARQCIARVKTETEQQLESFGQQLIELEKQRTTQAQISATSSQIETANIKLAQIIEILQLLNQQQNVPDKLRALVTVYLTTQSKIWEHSSEFATQVKAGVSHLSNLEALISSIAPFPVLENIKTSLDEQVTIIEQENTLAQKELKKIQTQIKKLDKQPEIQPTEDLILSRNWWENFCQTIPDKFQPADTHPDLFNLEFLLRVKNQFDVWRNQLTEEETYLSRYQDFTKDWIAKVKNPSERDRNDLRRIYLDNANVVGITCVQAANYNFSQEFKAFDVVIIDEVSKCTPPELLIPALKGKKLVLVGDHRQLPPMLDTSTIEEVAQSLGSTKAELQFLEESLFKIQFEAADKSVKQMLNTQYRMHPFIMGAINQFYQGKLECGLLEPDTQRAHNLTGEIIQKNHHLVWVKIPREDEFQEERENTSYFNTREIDIIERLCQQFEQTWAAKIAKGEPKKEIAVITFYGAQLKKIDERLQPEFFPSLEIRTGTVDRFQGMERPVVIVSMVRNNHQGDVGFAKKPERVNVAFSRAQELLVIVGCHDLFTRQGGKVGGMYLEISHTVDSQGGFVDVSRCCG
ncbi:AAA domain-containing protein [Nodularia spumigena CS-586/05]|uniref:AAA domain-containing protein n=1 Tax=Nodularia spumigena TaxID=70799 RepID=UPI002330CD49|nr:AAA domain-containing protein [Nodularia spumigena]MDB9345182.1 AAA domain-containing protein [Nodularia spumigena CS-588/06]MDB9371014.1 AAA domain-containing protein [Nodularia spumigena CS-586/05]